MDAPNDELVVEPAERVDLAEDLLLVVLGPKLDLLDGVESAVKLILRFDNLTEAALAEELDLLKVGLVSRDHAVGRRLRKLAVGRRRQERVVGRLLKDVVRRTRGAAPSVTENERFG